MVSSSHDLHQYYRYYIARHTNSATAYKLLHVHVHVKMKVTLASAHIPCGQSCEYSISSKLVQEILHIEVCGSHLA